MYLAAGLCFNLKHLILPQFNGGVEILANVINVFYKIIGNGKNILNGEEIPQKKQNRSILIYMSADNMKKLI